MIPKIIHYCWLSNDPIPFEAQECIRSWKKHMPEYKIKKWGMESLDINRIPFVKEAIAQRKWAFACDYIRCYAMYNEGGIYMDSDVFVKKSFDFALNNKAFSAMECYPNLMEKIASQDLVDENGDKRDAQSSIHGIQIQAAILGSEKGNLFFKDCLDYYDSHSFEYIWNHEPRLISPIIMANIAVKYGFKYINQEQTLDNGLHLYPTSIIAPQSWFAGKDTVAIHCCDGSWRKNLTLTGKIFYNIKNALKVLLNRFGLYHPDSLSKL